MAPSPSTSMTGAELAILVICIVIFTILLVSAMYTAYRSDKRRAEYALQYPRTPTPTATRPLNIPPASMAEIPPRQVPKSADASPPSGPWILPRLSGEASIAPVPAIRPQKAVPQPGAVPTRSSLSSRNGANGGTRPQTATSTGAGAGPGSVRLGSLHGTGSIGGRSQ